MSTFWLCFVPLFVAVNAFGILPLFLGLTEGMDEARRRKVIWQSFATALAVALLFLFLGPELMDFLRITVPDFMVAGGILLLIISITELLSMERTRLSRDPEHLGIVPLGVPLITGPAVLTTSILLLRAYGTAVTTIALVANIVIAGVVFWFARCTYRVLGRAGTMAISKITAILLAAIAVMMVRRGITDFLAGVK